MIREQDKEAIEVAARAFGLRTSHYLELYEKVWDLIMPERQDRKRTGADDNVMGNKVYDSTALNGVENLANYLTSTMFPAWEPYVFLEPGPYVPESEREELRSQLVGVNKIIQYNLQASNLMQEVQPSIKDCIVGTGCFIIEKHKSGVGLQFRNVPLKELMVDEDESGELNYIYRCYDMYSRDILKMYGDAVPEKIKKELQKKKDEKHVCWSILVPDGDTQKFRNIVVMEKYKEDFVLKSVQLGYNPYIAFRWSKVSDSPMGRGPAIWTYYDASYLNKLKEHGLRGLSLAVAGVWLGKDDGIFNPYSVRLEPGIILPVMDNNSDNPAMRRLEVGTDFNLAQYGMAELESKINKALFADRFGSLDLTPRPATETMLRDKIIAQTMAGTYGRFRTELLMKLVKNELYLLQEQGLIPKELRIDGRNITVTFVSKLEQAQRMQEVDNLMQFAGFAAEIGKQDPYAGQVPDFAKIIRGIAEKMQIDPNRLRSEKEVEAIITQAQESAMAMGQAAMEQNGQPAQPTA